MGYADRLELSPNEPDKLHENAEQIRNAGRKAASLTRQLLAFSRQQVLQPRVLDLNAVLADLGKMLRRLIGEDVELTMSIDPAISRVKADQSQIEQVIMNLVVNARDAMPEGGKLAIVATNHEVDEKESERMSYVPAGSYVQLDVTDTGMGMDEKTKARIFEPFFTTKEKGKGTGLGLAMAYGIVKQSGGYIWVSSELGKGTSFKILLPQVAEALQVSNAKLKVAKTPTMLRTVLLVEDEDLLRGLISDVLKQNGYRVLAASTGGQAKELERTFAGPIHLLLTDVVLPGLSGPLLAKLLTAARPEMRVLFMSGYVEFQSDGSGGLSPDAFLLHKPFTSESLLAQVADALSLSRSEIYA